VSAVTLSTPAKPAPTLPPDGAEPQHRPSGTGSRPAWLTAGLVGAVAGSLAILFLTHAWSVAGATIHVPQAVVLGAVEGITEFLPISSTGHLVLTERLFGLGGTSRALTALDSYAVIIQGGAILAVAWLFWDRLLGLALALGGMLRLPGFRREVAPSDRRLALAVVVALAPAGLIGFLLGDAAQHHLFSPVPIALAWLAGGGALLATAGWLHRRGTEGAAWVGLDSVTARQALLVGLAQVLALWPGVSRSLVTIAAGCLVGLSLTAAVELSFLLGFFLLVGASGLEIVKHGGDIVAAFGWADPLLGLGVAFVSAIAAIRWLLRVISGRSLAGFGWYRLAAGALALALVAAGRI